MNLLDLPLPPAAAILKYEGLIGAADWSEADKAELLVYLRALGAAREALVDGEIARRNLQAAVAAASDSSRRAKMEPLYDDGIVQGPSPSPRSCKQSGSPVEERGALRAPHHKRQRKKAILRLVGSTETHDAASDRIGTPCPGCGSKLCKGHARQSVVITANTLLSVNLHVREAVECKTCGHEDVTPLPEPLASGMVGRYAPSAIALLAYLRYFSGFASHRFETASECLGFAVPETTQWDLFEAAADRLAPLAKAFKALVPLAHVITMDHTGAKVVAEQRHRRLLGGPEPQRIGMTTSGYLVELENPHHRFAYFHTGPTDAGQYLRALLENRTPGMGSLVLACDALASNQNQDHPDVRIALCNVHARRTFLELGEHAPHAARDIFAEYDLVFKADCRAKGLSPEARLALHQTYSEPAMLRIRELALGALLAEERLPSGRVAEPFAYILRHFERLITFCRIPRAPVHTNDIERALKKPILHRKNSLFFQTFAGSGVGDLFTSLFFSADLLGHNPLAYVSECLENWRALARAPETFLPWMIPQLK